MILLALTLSQEAPSRLKAIEDAYQEEMKRLSRELEPLENDVDRHEKAFREKDPGRLYGPKMLSLAQEVRGSPTGLAATLKGVRIACLLKDAELTRGFARELESAYADMDSAVEAIPYLSAGITWDWKWPDSTLRALGQSKSRSVRAACRYCLGSALLWKKNADDAQRTEGRQLLKEAQADYADTYYGKKAEAYFFEEAYLQIGRVAPDFEATDEGGNRFKLSDYRGKIVVLDFWGFW